MINEETPIIIGLLVTFISVFIGLGYWWGSGNVPNPEPVFIELEPKIVEKSIYTEREKCNKLGGDFSAFDTHWRDQKDFNVECKIPAKTIEI